MRLFAPGSRPSARSLDPGIGCEGRRMTDGHPAQLAPYLELLSAFVERDLPAVEFEWQFIDRYLNDPTEWTEPEFQALDTLFGAVDAFESDPQLLPQVIGGIDEARLRDRAASALQALRELAAGPGTGA